MQTIEDAQRASGTMGQVRSARSLAATLMLSDGTCFYGRGAGVEGLASGEMVFTTAMTGYQEALTDPSYRGQLLMFTYPLIGNYGVSAGRAQSDLLQASGVIVATLSDAGVDQPSLGSYLARHGVPTMHGVDTRAIALWTRRHGAMPGVMSIHQEEHAPSLAVLRMMLDACSYETRDFVAESTVLQPEVHGYGSRRVALLDCGNKRSVIDELVQRDAQVIVLPAHTPTAEILALQADGVVISNGPGNPASAMPVVETIRELYGKIPLFGICLGHQLLALAAGGSTYKLKFGHRGANHPVQDTTTGHAFVTTQNHGYAVDAGSLPADLLVSHRNLNDDTVEGLRHRTLPIRSVQFHPEGAPGPKDAGVLLDEWLGMAA
jgi:carbamoyl-phosphate synthase small subunit